MPRPPALETAEASSAYPTHCMPPWTTGTGLCQLVDLIGGMRRLYSECPVGA